MVLAPMVRGRRGKQEDALARIRKAGFVRVRIDGELYDLENLPELDSAPRALHRSRRRPARGPQRRHAPVGRVDAAGAPARRGPAGRLLPGPAIRGCRPAATSGWQDRLFSTLYACPNCDLSVAEIEPRTFSFNSPYGACPRCGGLGGVEQFDPELVVPDPSCPWPAARSHRGKA